MKRMSPILLALLLAGSAYAQEEMPMEDRPMEQRTGAMEHEGIPLPSGARELAEKGNFEVKKSLEQIRSEYKSQLESQGYTVSPVSESESSLLWEVRKGEKTAMITIHKLEPESVMLTIQPKEEGKMQ